MILDEINEVSIYPTPLPWIVCDKKSIFKWSKLVLIQSFSFS